jgi:hypothetical protein
LIHNNLIIIISELGVQNVLLAFEK